MLLEEWTAMVHEKHNDYFIATAEGKGLHVIGTCDGCLYYADREVKSERVGYNLCKKRAEVWHRTDGCIHWELKK